MSEISKTTAEYEELLESEKNIPAGYERIVMSTKGLYGAPAILHIRNFSVEEAWQLGLMSQDELPIKVTSMLQNIIWEKDVDIKKFYDPEVAELMIKFYKTFYQSTLVDQKYELTKKDKEWVKKTLFKGVESTEYQDWLRGVKTGKIPMNYDLDLNLVKYYAIDENPHKYIKATKKGFEMMFQYPRFGDAALIQKIVKEEFRAEDKQFGPLYEVYKRKQDMEQALRRGDDIDQGAIPYIDQEDLNAVKDYETRKSIFVINQTKAMYLYSWGGEVVANKPLSERLEIARDPRFDYSLYQMISEKLNNLEIGPIPKVEIDNPVTHAREVIDHPFRTLELLAAIKDYGSDDTVIESV